MQNGRIITQLKIVTQLSSKHKIQQFLKQAQNKTVLHYSNKDYSILLTTQIITD